MVPARDILGIINDQFPLEPLDHTYSGEVATRYRYADGAGEIGIISSVSAPFCGDCTRLRLSADGSLYTCLFAASGTDLRSVLRDGASDSVLRTTIEDMWKQRSDRYSETRSDGTEGWDRAEMSYIGG